MFNKKSPDCINPYINYAGLQPRQGTTSNSVKIRTAPECGGLRGPSKSKRNAYYRLARNFINTQDHFANVVFGWLDSTY